MRNWKPLDPGIINCLNGIHLHYFNARGKKCFNFGAFRDDTKYYRHPPDSDDNQEFLIVISTENHKKRQTQKTLHDTQGIKTTSIHADGLPFGI